ncbi:hypothetical protein T07_14216 [Trichinella nelsoni]|uniref:Uncharacterized protein n=1 Tax=Trichinella nelsoni TaxID=6336 RepID=A0A0V0RVQ8_9BILA|nr:hypothetical protein T07_14216 [Trichinella nelsoni]
MLMKICIIQQRSEKLVPSMGLRLGPYFHSNVFRMRHLIFLNIFSSTRDNFKFSIYADEKNMSGNVDVFIDFEMVFFDQSEKHELEKLV